MFRAIMVFSLLLISVLAGKDQNIHAASSTLQFASTSHDQHAFIHKAAEHAKAHEYISIANEDEDPTNGRKLLLIGKFIATLAWIYTLYHFFNYSKNRLPFCSHLSYLSSYKYILQRVLRI